MAVSFTAEYLFQGAQFLQSDPNEICPEALLVASRGLYSFGLLAVSPVGVLYHTCAAAYRALAQCCAADGAEAQALNTRMWQHLYAARNDLLGAGLILVTSLLLACMVAACVLMEPRLLPLPIYALGHAYLDDSTDLIIPYYFGMHPGKAFERFLSDDRGQGGAFTQREEYFAYYMYTPMIKNGLAIDQPLTSAEIIDLNQRFNNLLRNPDPVGMILMPSDFLKNHNRIASAAVAHTEALLGKESELRAAWRASYDAAIQQPAESRHRFLTEHFGRRLEAITNTLPRIGAQAQLAPAV
jgi:hypothetical protein